MSSTTGSDSSAESATIAVSRVASPISRVARSPPPPGICTSTIATSGRASVASAIASSVSPAVATTSKWPASWAPRTARTSGSSSAISTRGRCPGMAAPLRQHVVDALYDEGGPVVVRQVVELLALRVAGEHERRRHPGVEAHADVRGEAVADDEAVGAVDVEPVERGIEHRGVRLPDRLLARRRRARLDRGGYRRAVRLAVAAGERAEAVGVRRDERGAAVDADRVEGDLQLAVVEAAVVARDDDVDLLRILRHADPGVVERPLQRGLGDREDDRIGVLLEQPARHRHGRVD